MCVIHPRCIREVLSIERLVRVALPAWCSATTNGKHFGPISPLSDGPNRAGRGSTGGPWSRLPRRYGSSTTCWRRLHEWQDCGLFMSVWQAFLAQLETEQRERWDALRLLRENQGRRRARLASLRVNLRSGHANAEPQAGTENLTPCVCADGSSASSHGLMLPKRWHDQHQRRSSGVETVGRSPA
jgi:hypothetical protein